MSTLTKSEWEVWSDEENGFYVRKPIYMSLPKEYDGFFETEQEAQDIADSLNTPPRYGQLRALELDEKEGCIDYFGKRYLKEWS